jgi:hypothetical protein
LDYQQFCRFSSRYAAKLYGKNMTAPAAGGIIKNHHNEKAEKESNETDHGWRLWRNVQVRGGYGAPLLLEF